MTFAQFLSHIDNSSNGFTTRRADATWAVYSSHNDETNSIQYEMICKDITGEVQEHSVFLDVNDALCKVVRVNHIRKWEFVSDHEKPQPLSA